MRQGSAYTDGGIQSEQCSPVERAHAQILNHLNMSGRLHADEPCMITRLLEFSAQSLSPDILAEHGVDEGFAWGCAKRIRRWLVK